MLSDIDVPKTTNEADLKARYEASEAKRIYYEYKNSQFAKHFMVKTLEPIEVKRYSH